MSGVHFTHTVKQHDAGVQLVIETPDASMNAGIFERLEAQRVAAEEDFGGPPEWDRVEGCKKCKIGLTLAAGATSMKTAGQRSRRR
jgi:hypothetical protein